MSRRQSVTRFGDPTHPTKLVITNVPPGPEAQALVDKYTAQLRHFHRAQQQNLDLSMEGGVAVHRGHTTFGDGTTASYSNVFGQETLRMEIAPEILAQLPQPVPGPYCFNWALIELTIKDMLGFESSWAVKLRKPLTTQPPSYDPHEFGLTGVMRFGASSPDASEENENLVESSDRILSLRVDLQPFHGQEMIIELYGYIRVRTVIGGEGGEGGVCVGSEMYGKYGVEDVDNPTSLDACSTLAPPALWISTQTGTGSEQVERRLFATFPETESFPTTDEQFIGTGYSISGQWAPSGFDGWAASPVDVVESQRAMMDQFAALNQAQEHIVTFWDDEQQHIRVESWVGTRISYSYKPPENSNDLDDFPTAIPATCGITFRDETRYHVPTWEYAMPRKGELKAVMVRPDNPWRQTSRHYSEEPAIDEPTNEDEDWKVESFVWETGGFPVRPNMKVIETDVIIPVEEPQEDMEPDEDGILERDEQGNIIREEDIDPTRFQGLPLIGIIKIEPCANSVKFEQAPYTPPGNGNGGGEGG